MGLGELLEISGPQVGLPLTDVRSLGDGTTTLLLYPGSTEMRTACVSQRLRLHITHEASLAHLWSGSLVSSGGESFVPEGFFGRCRLEQAGRDGLARTIPHRLR